MPAVTDFDPNISISLRTPSAPRPTAQFSFDDRIADYRRMFAFFTDVVENSDFALKRDPQSHDKMGRDGTIFSAMRIRQLAVASRSLIIQPKDESDGKARQYADTIKTMLSDIERFPEVLLNMLDAIAKGMSVQEIEWTLDDKLNFRPKKIFPVHISRFAFDTRNQLVLRSPIENYYGERLPPYSFLHHVFDPEAGDYAQPEQEGRVVFGHGLYDRLYPWWLWKAIALRFGLRSSERSASASLIWTYPQGNDDALAKVMQSARLFDQWSQVFVPSAPGYDVKPMQSQYATTDVFLKIINYIDSQMAKFILGSSMLLDTSGTGAYASLEVHERTTFGRIVSFDEKSLLSTLSNQLITYIFAMNSWDMRKRPLLKFQSGPRWSLTEVVNAIIKLGEIGFPVSFEMITEETGLRQPAPNESVITFNPLSGEINVTAGPEGPVPEVKISTPGDIPQIVKHRTAPATRTHTVRYGDKSPRVARSEHRNGSAVLASVSDEPPLEYAVSTWVEEINRAMHGLNLVYLTYNEETDEGFKIVRRLIEPYSFRKRGEYGLLYARDVEDDKPIKSFKVESILGAEVLDDYTFTPRFNVEPTDG